MRPLACLLRLWMSLFLFGCLAPLPASRLLAQTPRVQQVDLHDTLQTERALIFAREMSRASAQHYDAVLVNLSTPGGTAKPVDTMVLAIRQSHVPVIVWAGEPHTQVAGEGLRLLAEADIALLNPETFLNPLWEQRPHGLWTEARTSGSQRLLEMLNSAAVAHGRSTAANSDLAGGTHRISAYQAVQTGFVEGIADRPADALDLANGRAVGRLATHLYLDDAKIDIAHLRPQEQLLLTLMNPDLSVLLLTLGVLLIYLEINTPGTIIPGAAGVLLILLSSYALLLMPLSVPGLLLCIGAVLLLLLEAQFRARGVLACTGIAALVLGLRTLVMGPVPQLQVSWAVAIGAGIGLGGTTAALTVLGFEARRTKSKTGAEAILGSLAVTHTKLAPEGHVLVQGELWRARLDTPGSFLPAGEPVKVLRADGKTLEVTSVPVAATT